MTNSWPAEGLQGSGMGLKLAPIIIPGSGGEILPEDMEGIRVLTTPQWNQTQQNRWATGSLPRYYGQRSKDKQESKEAKQRLYSVYQYTS